MSLNKEHMENNKQANYHRGKERQINRHKDLSLYYALKIPTCIKGFCCALENFQCEGSHNVSLSSNRIGPFNCFASQRSYHLCSIDKSQTLQKHPPPKGYIQWVLLFKNMCVPFQYFPGSNNTKCFLLCFSQKQSQETAWVGKEATSFIPTFVHLEITFLAVISHGWLQFTFLAVLSIYKTPRRHKASVWISWVFHR